MTIGGFGAPCVLDCQKNGDASVFFDNPKSIEIYFFLRLRGQFFWFWKLRYGYEA